ncbi:S26 family signal peptidase, partial [Bifidobacteriaceae bacterium NR021]
KRAKNDRLTLRDAITWFGIPVLVVILIRVFLFGAYTIPSGSMLDTIHIGDYVIT